MTYQIPFSDDEKDYILRHQGPGPEHQSWGEIAEALNKIYFAYNKGSRARGSVYRFATEFINNYAIAVAQWQR